MIYSSTRQYKPKDDLWDAIRTVSEGASPDEPSMCRKLFLLIGNSGGYVKYTNSVLYANRVFDVCIYMLFRINYTNIISFVTNTQLVYFSDLI